MICSFRLHAHSSKCVVFKRVNIFICIMMQRQSRLQNYADRTDRTVRNACCPPPERSARRIVVMHLIGARHFPMLLGLSASRRV